MGDCSDQDIRSVFERYSNCLSKEQENREQIRNIVGDIDKATTEAYTHLQVIHMQLEAVGKACLDARQCFDKCRQGYEKLKNIIADGDYYKYQDQWRFVTQKTVFLIALTIYLESGILVTRETVAEILGMEVYQENGFHLNVEDYLFGLLQLANELSRYAVNSVILKEYSRPGLIYKFLTDLSIGFSLLNLKNSGGLRKKFDGLKYDVTKVEEIVYDLNIRGLVPTIPN